MSKHFWRKITAILCIAALAIGINAGGLGSVAYAGLGYWPETLEYPNQYYYEGQTLQPYGTCFFIDELKNWSPDNDPDARYNRGSIPLRERWMGPNVNPKASRDAKVMPLAMGNSRASQAPSQGGNGASVYAFNNFQYVTTYNFWGGSSAEGPIAIPSPELIDSAHRNGVPVTGTIFIPWGDAEYGNRFVTELVERAEDGSYPAGDKLIEIAQYYGFDGYIFNAESGTNIAGFKDFLAYLQEVKPDNFTITWYNGSGSLTTGSIQSWMQDGDRRIVDDWWLDMGGRGNVDGTIQAAQETGVNPWNIYSTWEYWPMSSDPSTKGGDYQTRLDENGMLKCSLGILAPTVSLMQAKSPEEFMNVQDQKLWVGPDLDPSSDYYPAREFCGFGHLVADRTPVIGTDFVTNFNTGNGYRFYEEGVVSGKEDGWYNRSLGDVLPTWRWIIDSEGEKLDAIIDYDDAWEGGTSLKLSGGMDAGAPNHVKLYSSQLLITSQTEFSMIYKTDESTVDVELGLCFGETYDEENFTFYPLNISASGDWETCSVDLSEKAGETAIAISLRFTGGVSGYAINVGEMAFTTNNAAPGATSKVTLDEVLYHSDRDLEARIYWEPVPNAFIYRIYRVYGDGAKEFVGATPNTAFYLGEYEKSGTEMACTFEIVSYSENGVMGSGKEISIDWPAEVENGFAPVIDEGVNLALKVPALSSGATVGDGPIHQLNDGTVLNGSKWCVANTKSGYAILDLGENKTIQRWVVYHANCPGAGEGVAMNTVNFDLQYAADDGGDRLISGNTASEARVKALQYSMADTVTDNKLDITDRNLSKPITARYIKLNIDKADDSPWSAIRIYELELYESTMPEGYSSAESPTAKNVTIKNDAGTGTVIVDNVTMLYTSGTYENGNGVFHEDTGKVRLFTSLEAEEPVAIMKATQPNVSYEQRSIGKAKFENLDLTQFDGRRLYYDVLDGSGSTVVHSRRASVPIPPADGTPAAVGSVQLFPTTAGSQLRKQYAKLIASDVEEGAILHIFDSADAETAILRTLPAKAIGVIEQMRVPLDKEGGSIWYEVHKEGKPDSVRYELSYPATSEMTADLSGLQEWIDRCDAISVSGCTSSSYSDLSAALSTAKRVSSSASLDEAEAARAGLAKAYANLRYKGNSQRLSEICAEYEEKYFEESNAASSWAPYQAALDAVKEAIDADDSSNAEYEQLRIALESAARNLIPKGTILSVTISPDTVRIARGGAKQFAVKIETSVGTIETAASATWEVTGGTSADTSISEEGLLSVGADETAQTLEVKATSIDDVTKSGEAVVSVVDEIDSSENLALNSKVLGSIGKNTPTVGEESEKAFDGDTATKWCVQTPAWVVFDIGTTVYPEKLRIVHANGTDTPEGPQFNTKAFTFEILAPEKYSEADFQKLDDAAKAGVMAVDDNWIQLVTVTDNTEDISEHELMASRPVQIFRIKVTDGDTTTWADTVRIHEIELYGVEAEVPNISVTIEPEEMTVSRGAGQKGQFTALVKGTTNQAVNWSISGNTSADTRIDNGQLFFGDGETASRMTVTAVSVEDSASKGTAVVIVEECVHSDMTHVAAQEATCTEPGNIEYWHCGDCDKYFCDADGIEEVELPDTVTEARGHQAIHHVPNEPTETETGNIEYWWCANCSKYFADAACENEIEQAETVRPATGHDKVHHERVEATETENGNIEYWTCNNCGKFFADEDCTDEIREADTVIFAENDPNANCEHLDTEIDIIEPTCTKDGQEITYCSACGKTVSKEPIHHLGHDAVEHGGVEPTCETGGNIAYWTCERCGKYFRDEACAYEIEEGSEALPAAGHSLVHHPRIEPTETKPGNIEYWKCNVCDRYFDSEDCDAEITYEETVIPATGHEHTLTYFPAVEPTETESGNIEYWQCGSCGKYFADADCTNEITYEQTVIPATGHTHSAAYVPAVEPSYEAPGNIAYWVCENCGKLFLDTACTEETTLADVTLPQLKPDPDPDKPRPPVNPGGSNGGSTTRPVDPPTEPSEPSRPSGDTYATVDTETVGNTSNVTLDDSTADAIIAEAVNRDSENIILTVDAPDHVTEVVVTIPSSTMADLTGKTDANLTVSTPVADVTITNTGIASLGSGMETVEISTKADGDTVKVTVSKDGQPVSSIPGGLQASIPVADAAPGTVAILVDENGNEMILKKVVAMDGTMALALAGSATIKIVDNSKDFSDTQTHWAGDAIDFVTSRELFQGTGPNTFSANAAMSRAMLVTVLHRLEDTPIVGGSAFGDVDPSAYYAEAVSWAFGQGIVTGNGTGFNPDGQVTREELATFLYRYAKATGVSTAATGSLTGFSDGESVSGWASEAMRWAVGAGIIGGSGGNLNPSAPATRAEVATILMRFCQNLAK